jgi:hypothetical protein
MRHIAGSVDCVQTISFTRVMISNLCEPLCAFEKYTYFQMLHFVGPVSVFCFERSQTSPHTYSPPPQLSVTHVTLVGGHDNHHYNNIYGYVGHGLGVCGQIDGHEDYFYNNSVVMTGNDVGGFTCEVRVISSPFCVSQPSPQDTHNAARTFFALTQST